MAEYSFTEVMREWRRMCRHYTTSDEETCCDGCALLDYSFDGHGCDAIFSDFAEHANWDEVAQIVMEWAKENPKPDYPTWAEWLTEQGLIYVSNSAYMQHWFVVNQRGLDEPIPAHIAEKLGLEPKEE